MNYEELNKTQLSEINGGDEFSKCLGYLWGRTHGAIADFFEGWWEGTLLVWPD